jgi:hypothetical protein
MHRTAIGKLFNSEHVPSEIKLGTKLSSLAATTVAAYRYRATDRGCAMPMAPRSRMTGHRIGDWQWRPAQSASVSPMTIQRMISATGSIGRDDYQCDRDDSRRAGRPAIGQRQRSRRAKPQRIGARRLSRTTIARIEFVTNRTSTQNTLEKHP